MMDRAQLQLCRTPLMRKKRLGLEKKRKSPSYGACRTCEIRTQLVPATLGSTRAAFRLKSSATMGHWCNVVFQAIQQSKASRADTFQRLAKKILQRAMVTSKARIEFAYTYGLQSNNKPLMILLCRLIHLSPTFFNIKDFK